jgi:hypothetical protein
MQRRPDDQGGWAWSVKGVRQVPYLMIEMQEAIANDRKIVIVEGEKDADALWKLNIPATTNAGGAGKWSPALNEFFREVDVTIVPDNDPPAKNPDGTFRFSPCGKPIFPGQDHARAVARSLGNLPRRVRILELPGLPPKGDVSDWIANGGTAAELWHLLETAAVTCDDYKGPTLDADIGNGPPISSLNERDAGDDPGPIPPRGWLLGNQFCRKFLSSIVATGGTGKTALRLLQYLALATGRALTGEHLFRRCRALLLSFEDDDQELDRRVAAALKHHNVDRSDIKGWLYIAAPKGVKLAEMKNGSRQIGELEKLLREAIQRRKPDIIGLDPFIKLHALEENDNGAMDFVCDLLTRLAIEYDIAVDAPHHQKKGTPTPGDADSGRGGSSIKDAGRLVHTLTSMNEEEAKMFGISEADRHGYVRLDPAKVNIVRRSQKAKWFRLVGVRLGNGTKAADGSPGGDYPNGDEVQTVEPWTPPELWADVSAATLNTVLSEIDAGMPNGQRYSDAPNAKERAAWYVVQKHCPNKTEGQCREIIRTWVKNGVLYRDDYNYPIKR